MHVFLMNWRDTGTAHNAVEVRARFLLHTVTGGVQSSMLILGTRRLSQPLGTPLPFLRLATSTTTASAHETAKSNKRARVCLCLCVVVAAVLLRCCDPAG